MPAATKPARETREELHDRLTVPPRHADGTRVNAPGEDLRPPRVRAAGEGLAPRTREQILAVMDAQEWACRSQEHSWPQLLAGATEPPAGMRFSAAGAGNVLQADDCLHDCGRYRETLLQNGYMIVSRTYGTRPGRRHTVVHRDEAMTKGEMRQSTLSANAKLIKAAVKADTAARKAADREAKAARKGNLMGTDGKYGRVTTEHGDIPENEPVIVFRARDRLTPVMLSFYRELCAEAGSPQRHLDLISESRRTFEQWQDANPGEVRAPDSERSREWMP
jgi:hypothetical protein